MPRLAGGGSGSGAARRRLKIQCGQDESVPCREANRRLPGGGPDSGCHELHGICRCFRQKRRWALDVPEQCCGVCLPTLTKRIGNLLAKGIPSERIVQIYEAPIVEMAFAAMRFDRARQKALAAKTSARPTPTRVAPGPAG